MFTSIHEHIIQKLQIQVKQMHFNLFFYIVNNILYEVCDVSIILIKRTLN